MKKYAFNEITSMQYIFLNSGIQVSVFFLSMPRKLAEKAGTDGWIALMIGWAITVAASLIVIQVMKKHPEGTLFDLLTKYLGNWTGKVAAILFSLYLLYYAYTGLIQAVLITKSWLLPLTSASIVMALLLIPTYVIARNGLRILGRYAELVFMISFWIPFVYLLLLKVRTLAQYASRIKGRLEARILSGAFDILFLYWICNYVYFVSVFEEQTKGF